jgi:hypothetical protein
MGVVDFTKDGGDVGAEEKRGQQNNVWKIGDAEEKLLPTLQ